MKKRLFIITLITLISISASAQLFELTNQGFVDVHNKENNYVIVPFEGKSQQEIFNLALEAIGKSFVSPDDRFSKVEYSQINLNGIYPNATVINRMGLKLNFNMHYNIIFQFKDGKMRINGPIINKIVRDVPFGGQQQFFLTTKERGGAISGDKALFTPDGKVYEKKHKANIENAGNALVDNILKIMKSTSNSDW
jgi:hypothetical protein